MRIPYDREEDILTLKLSEEGRIDHAEQVETIILHLNETDQPVLLEILHASDFLADVLKTSLQPEQAAA